MKILFLDHDGVICLKDNFGTRFKKGFHLDNSILNRFDDFDKESIKVLNDIIKQTDCEIVVSSDWRHLVSIEEMGMYYEYHGVLKKPFDFTPSINDIEIPINFEWERFYDLEQSRGMEIKEWLKKHPEVTQWVAVDDMNLGLYDETYGSNEIWGLSNFVLTGFDNEGIKEMGIKEKIIKFLE